MTTVYNLSYNNQAMLDQLLSNIVFNTKYEAEDFIDWFNQTIETNKLVPMSSICDKLWIDIPEGKEKLFDTVGFNNKMYSGDAMFSTYKDGWVVIFPWFVDFKQLKPIGAKK